MGMGVRVSFHFPATVMGRGVKVSFWATVKQQGQWICQKRDWLHIGDGGLGVRLITDWWWWAGCETGYRLVVVGWV